MDESIMETILTKTLNQADEVVWPYLESITFLKPPNQGGASRTRIDAIKNGKNAGITTTFKK